ncbi:MAG: hypothetical protein GTN49_10960 [candidate division Zixibacteria bacterium]|nr:hypothetical protein [candidate division Zixibacteria bacterium]
MADFEDIKKTIKDGVTYAAERAEKLSRAAALRLRIFALRRRIERLFAELGETVYILAGEGADVRTNAGVKKKIKNIAALEREVEKIFAQLEKLSRRKRAARRQTATKKKTKTRTAAPKRRKTGR